MTIPMNWLAIPMDWQYPYTNWPPLTVKFAYKEERKAGFPTNSASGGPLKARPFAMARGNKQFQCPDCTTMVSRQKELKRHMMLHTKSEQHWYACPDCPVRLLQKSNLETHRAKHQYVH
ncbi:hypothetical protein DFS33DRAFT_515034 [Desarmillaria ectypa]|nr:hypothetical protein DFS33DRAFT_515034 [Desarmillaria ectypa]